MIAISNQSLTQINTLLLELNGLTGTDNRTLNIKRKAKLMINKLKRCKSVTNGKQRAET